MDLSLIAILAPVVLIAGFIDSIAGGGGLLTVPAYLIAGLPPTIVLGTNKVVSSMGTSISVMNYIRNRQVLWPVVIIGIPCAFLGSTIGAHTVVGLTQDIVRQVILVVLPIAALLTLIPKRKSDPRLPGDGMKGPGDDNHAGWRSPRLWITVPLIGLSVGWYDGFFGPGTGSFMLLGFYGLTRLTFLQGTAASRLLNFTSNLAAAITFLWHGKVLFALVVPLGLASMAGHYLGSHLAIRHGERFIRVVLAVAVSLLFFYLIWEHYLTP